MLSKSNCASGSAGSLTGQDQHTPAHRTTMQMSRCRRGDHGPDMPLPCLFKHAHASKCGLLCPAVKRSNISSHSLYNSIYSQIHIASRSPSAEALSKHSCIPLLASCLRFPPTAGQAVPERSTGSAYQPLAASAAVNVAPPPSGAALKRVLPPSSALQVWAWVSPDNIIAWPITVLLWQTGDTGVCPSFVLSSWWHTQWPQQEHHASSW